MNKQEFIEVCKKNNLNIVEKPAKWPYNHGNNVDLYITNTHGVTMRFFFNDDGIMMSKEIMPNKKGK